MMGVGWVGTPFFSPIPLDFMLCYLPDKKYICSSLCVFVTCLLFIVLKHYLVMCDVELFGISW